MTAQQDTFIVDYPCDRHCQVEIDLTGEKPSTTVRQLRAAAHLEHEQRHAQPAASLPAFLAPAAG